jgi:toxin YoeB
MQGGTRLVSWKLVFTKQAQKDAKKITKSGLKPQANRLLDILVEDPLQNPPPYEKLMGDLSGAYSRRINIQDRLIYQVLQDVHTVKIIRMWTHYE